jgi:hypothetical protein
MEPDIDAPPLTGAIEISAGESSWMTSLDRCHSDRGSYSGGLAMSIPTSSVVWLELRAKSNATKTAIDSSRRMRKASRSLAVEGDEKSPIHGAAAATRIPMTHGFSILYITQPTLISEFTSDRFSAR